MNRTRIDHTANTRFFDQLVSLCIVAVLAAASSAHAAESGRAKRVLMLFSGSQFAPGSALVEQSVQQVLQKGPQTVDFYAEYLDANRLLGKATTNCSVNIYKKSMRTTLPM